MRSNRLTVMLCAFAAAATAMASPAAASVAAAPAAHTPAPTITQLSVTTGPVAGSSKVTIHGTGFAGTTAVLFGSAPATSIRTVDSATVTAVTSAHAAGLVGVRYVGRNGRSAEVDADHFLYGGPTLTATDLPATQGGAGPPESILAATCPAPGTCYVVGDAGDEHSGATSPVLLELTNGSWQGVPVPVPVTGFARGNYLDSIACATAGDCVALGNEATASGGAEPFAMVRRNGGDWTKVLVPRSGDLVCPAAGSCVLSGGGNVADAPGFTSFDGTTMTEQTGAPIPGAASATPAGIVCTSTTYCVEWGQYTTTGKTPRTLAFVEQLRDGTVSAYTVPAPSDAGSSAVTESDLQSVRCSAAGECVGFGNYGDGKSYSPMRVVLSQGKIAATTLGVTPDPRSTQQQGRAQISPITCGSSTTCLGLVTPHDQYRDANTDHAFLDTLTGDSFTSTAFGTRVKGALYALTDTMCAATGPCYAGGEVDLPVPPPNFGIVGVLLLPSGSRYVQVDAPRPPSNPEDTYASLSTCAPTGSFCLQVNRVQTGFTGSHYDYAVTITQ